MKSQQSWHKKSCVPFFASQAVQHIRLVIDEKHDTSGNIDLGLLRK